MEASCKYLTRTETGDWRLETGDSVWTRGGWISHLCHTSCNMQTTAFCWHINNIQYLFTQKCKAIHYFVKLLWIVYLRQVIVRQTMEWLRYCSSRVKRFSQGNWARASHDTFHRIEEIGNWTISEANIMSSDGNVRKPGIYFSANIKIVIFLVRKIRELA